MNVVSRKISRRRKRGSGSCLRNQHGRQRYSGSHIHIRIVPLKHGARSCCPQIGPASYRWISGLSSVLSRRGRGPPPAYSHGSLWHRKPPQPSKPLVSEVRPVVRSSGHRASPAIRIPGPQMWRSTLTALHRRTFFLGLSNRVAYVEPNIMLQRRIEKAGRGRWIRCCSQREWLPRMEPFNAQLRVASQDRCQEPPFLQV